MSANPNKALTTVIRGLLKGHTAAGDGQFPELRLAPHLPQRGPNGQYQVRLTPTRYNQQLQTADKASWGGQRRKAINLSYDTVATKLQPFESDVAVIPAEIVEMLQVENPDLSLLDDYMEIITESIQGRMAEEVATAVATFTNNITIDLSDATTDLAYAFSLVRDDIYEETGKRPNVAAFGQRAVTAMAINNNKIQSYYGRASVGGATVGAVGPAQVEAYWREVVGVDDFIVLDRSVTNTAGAAAFQWSSAGFFGHVAGGSAASALKTAAPTSSLFETIVGDLTIMEGGPGTAAFCKGPIQVVTPDLELGSKVTISAFPS